jgi:uncharacterized protein YbjQ (UPF0145 family)
MAGWITFLVLVLLGMSAGTVAQRRHLRSLAAREADSGGFLITQIRFFPFAVVGPAPPTLVCSEVVISSDYFKTLLGNLRKIFGGELASYRSLVERARREAVQRLVEQATGRGYNAICNVRFETSDISGAAKGGRGIVMVTLLASATAYHCDPSADSA